MRATDDNQILHRLHNKFTDFSEQNQPTENEIKCGDGGCCFILK